MLPGNPHPDTPFADAGSADRTEWRLCDPASDQQPLYDFFIDPRHVHTDAQQLALAPQPYQFDSLPVPASSLSSPHMQAVEAPDSDRATPCSFASGADDHASLVLDNRSVHGAEAQGGQPYNQLLWRCLMSAPHYELLLKNIYAWFRQNTDKGRDPNSKGWQNSIRHNLSMNPAFQKGSRSQQDPSITNMWSLTDRAIVKGVEPTTRFRNTNVHVGGARARGRPAPVPGPIRATRQSARLRPTSEYDVRNPSVAPMQQAAMPSSYQQADAVDYTSRQNENLFDSIGAWNGGNVAPQDGTPPYFVDASGSVQPLPLCDMSGVPAGGEMFQDGYAGDLGDVASTCAAGGEMQGPAMHTGSVQGPCTGAGEAASVSGGADEALAMAWRASPPCLTPPLEEARLSGMWAGAAGRALFTDDDDAWSSDQDTLRTPPQETQVGGYLDGGRSKSGAADEGNDAFQRYINNSI